MQLAAGNTTVDDELTGEQLRLVCVVYLTALVPLVLIPILYFMRKIPNWVPVVYFITFLTCALGWELWFTYGWVGGDPVNERRAPALTAAMPQDINWLLNSLADAGTIGIGGLWLVWVLFCRDGEVLRRWHWGAFGVLTLWLIGQNVFVEIFLYHDQLAEGKLLSWAPLAPTGSWFNPTLFVVNGRTVTLQGQLPWVLLTPLFYAAVIWFIKRSDARTQTDPADETGVHLGGWS